MDCASQKFALLASAVALVSLAGCQREGPLARAGIAMTPPAGWRLVAATANPVPGVPVASWAGPEGSSLVLFRTLPAPNGSAAMIAESLANRLLNLPELKVLVRRTEKRGDTTAARVEVVAPGTGDALAPSGIGKPTAPPGTTLFPTRQVTVGFERPDATLYLRFSTPESAYQKIAPDIESTLESIRFTASSRQ